MVSVQADQRPKCRLPHCTAMLSPEVSASQHALLRSRPPSITQRCGHSISTATTCSTKGPVSIYYSLTLCRLLGSHTLIDTLHGHSPQTTMEKPSLWKLNRSTFSSGNPGQPREHGQHHAAPEQGWPPSRHPPSSKCNTLQRFLTPPRASVPLSRPPPMPTHVRRSSRGC